MRRAQRPDGARIFNVAEFLSPQQISSYFSRLAAKVWKQLPDNCDVQASEEEINFMMARNLPLWNSTVVTYKSPNLTYFSVTKLKF